MLEVSLASLLIMLASLVGAIFVWKQIGKIIERNLNFLVSFSAGVFLIIAYELTNETIEHAGSFQDGLLWITAGAVAILIAFRLLPTFHHHHDEKDNDSHSHSRIDARRILASDALHNIGDGILLAASFAVSVPLGIVTTLSIFVHELVQEVSEFFVLRQAGYSTKRALTLNFLVSGTILIGAVGGLYLLDQFEALEVPLLGIAAGSFLIVVVYDLIPHSVRTSQRKAQYFKHGVWFVVGLLLMFSINQFFVHGEPEKTVNENIASLTVSKTL